MGKPGNTGFKRLFNATLFSWQGYSAAWKNEAAFRQELALVVVLAPLAIWLGQTALERAVLIGCLMIVLIVELLNSAIEAAIDRHGNEQNELSGRAKDLGSAAVLTSLVLVAVVWALIAADRFLGAGP
ncbi:MAG: diacylglycerol kinase [Gammaproteobacteria bacterium]|nr:diacylglycerol kinase [Gammaproteobacteria bacterium]MDH5303909.1 diacylglycerol kinase [Gammaproteobacteria bacterium]MDH5321795.1 diacylglycerol kinase [Gammaproteobacteria bacterium]